MLPPHAACITPRLLFSSLHPGSRNLLRNGPEVTGMRSGKTTSADAMARATSAAAVNEMVRSLANPVPRPSERGDAFDYLVVGAGFAGSVLAERLASELDLRVLVVEKRNHVGGNAYDRHDDTGVLVHPYGPHIFHTNSAQIFEYLSRFTRWRPYQHRVLASV